MSSPEELDRPLFLPAVSAVHDRALRFDSEGLPRIADLTRKPSHDELVMQLDERLRGYLKRLHSGDHKTAAPYKQALEVNASELQDKSELHVALAPVDISCVPLFAPIYSTVDDPRFDRNLCSKARAQEPIEVLATFRDARLVRTRFGWGFIGAQAALSPTVPAEHDALYRSGPELVLQQASTLLDAKRHKHELPAGTLLKQLAPSQDTVLLATKEGFQQVALPGTSAIAAQRSLTRRALLTEALSLVGTPYGWGDQNGGRDCSRFVLDVLARFGLHFPRTSSEQSLSGTYSIEVPAQASETERLGLLDEAQQRGVVLLHFPGHIMFYLGRDKQGIPRIVHSLSDYAAPCAGGGETIMDVSAVRVSDLSLGKGSSRRSLLERITRMTVLGAPPGHALLALSKFRRPVPPTNLAPKECNDSLDVALFRAPRAPHAGTPLRVIAATTEDTRPAGLFLVDPHGQLISAEVHELGVGPYARWAEVDNPESGRWTALLADGDRVLACEQITVSKSARAVRERPVATGADGSVLPQPAWPATLKWERDTENLYAAFVEQLFTVPEGTSSWPALTPLLSSPTQNLLFNYHGADEDTRLPLAPDCADLPYFLRSYFAWKLSLPFAFRHCTRGRAGVAPTCTELVTNETPVTASEPVAAYEAFLKTQLASGVHSASGRTLPQDENTDIYPLPLRREALKPGTVYADPYGHVIVVAKWLPQGIAGAGMLLGVDAQPDATVALRRFWRGNFLFSPDTRDVGAGFKAFRPIVRDPETKTLVALSGDQLRKSRDFTGPSDEQYRGSQDDFYARMDELIYPRPITVADRMRQVVDALYEQVVRRVEAVDVGEAGLKTVKLPIAMPDGYAIFETTGAWEDFATPSRDMRLLIAIDAVRALPQDVRTRPQRFGVGVEEAATRAQQVEQELTTLLTQRSFRYTKSDGSPQDLTLSELIGRSGTLELAYNPNDCVETRWGAAEGSDEAKSCRRSAPPTQRKLMAKYRAWFATRTRPARP